MTSIRLLGLVFAGALVSACGTGSGGGDGTSIPRTAGERMCASLKDAVARCGGGTCDQALVDDCAKLSGVLSDPYLGATADCLDKSGAPTGCLASSLSALAPTPGQEKFVQAFCDQCPPVPIPGCVDALLGKGNVPEQLKSVRQVLSPLGDPVLSDIEQQCFGGMTCLAELSSCVQQVLVARAVPTNTVQCLLGGLMSDPGSKAPSCGEDGGSGGAGGSSGGAGGSGSTGGSSGGGSGGSGGTGSTGGTGGSGGASGGAGGTGSAGGSGGGGSGGTGGSGGASCIGHCGGQAPGGCWCDAACQTSNDCCPDKLAMCGSGGTGGSGGSGGSGGAGGGACTDKYEPNDTQGTARVIDTGGDGTISDCEPAQSLVANAGLGNVDWYQFKGIDSACGFDDIQPHARLTSGSGFWVCVYLKPKDSNASPACLKGFKDSSLTGYYGCCSAIEARLKFGSNLANDEGHVVIKVENTANVCTAYSLQYAYGK